MADDDARRLRFNPQSLQRARAMRSHSAPAEGKLWQRLRNRKLDGLKFRRQDPIGPYIVDFVCMSERLIVELDGPSHDERQDHDAARTRWLESEGYRVLRFLNEDVHRSIDDVLRTILRACGRAVD